MEDNLKTIEKYGIGVLVSKDSGEAGGLYEKIESARRMNIPVILVRRPDQEAGVFTVEQLMDVIGGK